MYWSSQRVQLKSVNWRDKNDTSDPCTPSTTMYHVQGSERPQLYIQTDLAKPAAMPNFYGIHPHRWTKEDVRQWLEWCIEEYALEGVQVDKFACMNGKALCMLTKQNFSERAKNVGDVLYNTLQQRLLAATSPDAFILPPSAFYHGVMPPSLDQRVRSSYDYRTPGVASPASPHDLCTVHSPLVAASPPSIKPHAPFFHRQISMPNGRPYLTPHRPSSRSPSPRPEDSPINLTKTGGESSRESTPTTPAPRHSLIIPGGRKTPSPPQHSPHGGHPPRLHRQVSEGSALYNHHQHHHHHHHGQHSPQHYPHPAPGSRSPTRRPSPSSMGMPEPAHKMAKLCSSSQGPSSPLMSPDYLSPIVHPFRTTSPEGFRDLSKKLAYVRMDSRDDTTYRHYTDISGQPHFGNTSLLDGRQVEAISDPEAEDGTTGSDMSAASECDSPVEDGKASVRQYGGGSGSGDGGSHVLQNGHPSDMHQHIQNGRHASREGHIRTSNGHHPPHSLQIPVTVNTAENIDEFYNPDKPDGEGGQGDTKLLWEFIYQLLRNPEYTSLLRWEDESRLVFRIINPSKLAYLWGLQKSRDNMTYEKLSRALRYYYRMNIIVKEPHRRLTYRFVKPPEHIQRGQKGAKPGVAHKRRSSGPHSDVPRIAVTTHGMTSPNTNVIRDVTSTGATDVIRHASEEELTKNMFKQEVLTNTVGASVFPTNMPLSLSMTVHEQGSSGGYLSLNNSPSKNSPVMPEGLSYTHESTHGSFGLVLKQDQEETGMVKDTHAISEKETGDASGRPELGRVQIPDNNTAMLEEHSTSMLEEHSLVVKQELPQLSPMNNNNEWDDRETGTTEKTSPVTQSVSSTEVENKESH